MFGHVRGWRALRKRGIMRVNGYHLGEKGDPCRVEFNFRYLFIGIHSRARALEWKRSPDERVLLVVQINS